MLRSGKSSTFHEPKTKIVVSENMTNASDSTGPAVIKREPIEIVDSEVSFNYKNAKNTDDETNTSMRTNINNNSIQIVDEDISFNFNTFNSKTEPIEVVDEEISFNFTKQKRQQQRLVDWLTTMVIIYQDLLIFDIKSEPKDDYEVHCCTGNVTCCEMKMLGTKKRTGKMEFRKKPAKWKHGIY